MSLYSIVSKWLSQRRHDHNHKQYREKTLVLKAVSGSNRQSVLQLHKEGCFVSNTMLSVLIIVQVGWLAWDKLELNPCSVFIRKERLCVRHLCWKESYVCGTVAHWSANVALPGENYGLYPTKRATHSLQHYNSAHQASPWFSDSLICYLICQCVGNQLQLRVAMWACDNFPPRSCML